MSERQTGALTNQSVFIAEQFDQTIFNLLAPISYKNSSMVTIANMVAMHLFRQTSLLTVYLECLCIVVFITCYTTGCWETCSCRRHDTPPNRKQKTLIIQQLDIHKVSWCSKNGSDGKAGPQNDSTEEEKLRGIDLVALILSFVQKPGHWDLTGCRRGATSPPNSVSLLGLLAKIKV